MSELREKIKDIVNTCPSEIIALESLFQSELEKQSDEFAVEFAKWLLNSNHFIQTLDASQLLEKYKQRQAIIELGK